MEQWLATIADRAGAAERGESARLLALVRADTPAARDELARTLTEAGRPLWARELAACALGAAGDRRAFETLVFLLNYRDPARGENAAEALARLGDPRTARAAAALAANELRTAYALHPVRLLARLAAPESRPVLTATLARLLAGPEHHWPVARACVEGLGRLGDPAARAVLVEAGVRPELRDAVRAALRRLPGS
ncbi:HEAT repeat domain-containing protein [Streptomyces sp. TRM 70351]|uniref:HEAT repeat domain-containing protein n=1 Tax=Streptomyces sp. TRM 70351 TaxID=3116552 RepID=UPI002E7B5201|nr:HEAT repeat domain-containing protein [Streptomyces sp. TRM 70351]MEE1926922.1 HEAT repeat domain-containing protein [Streptomyces sp. TRM 70351]